MEGDTSRSGVPKTKFVPNVAAGARRSTPPAPEIPKPVAVRGRGRGRGAARPHPPRSGLLTPVAVSGPFAHGPAAAANKSRTSSFTTNTLKSKPTTMVDSNPSLDYEEDSNLEQVLAQRIESAHLPVSLLSLSAEDVIVKTEGGRNIIMDDVYLDGSALLDGERKLFLVQLPSCIPVMRDESNTTVQPDTLPSALLTGEEHAMDIDAFRSLESNTKPEATSAWPTTAEGLYGKIQRHASGRLSLLVNGQQFTAVPSTTRPELTGIRRAVAIDTEYEQSFDLGQLSDHLVFVPHIEQLIAQYQ
ncbi:hypothetical protein PSACC_01833 [Paramicrosporidium saccamoebae]|uniref:DNA-directed RNA polymerase III subunit RPC4 n=1 Tax=Paramicrosporidium saccamoebae TaxID=1246581 RepID=A0A2H9TKQ4_9FUNG|nr:hypothetical protein PSACC_01833 [Paramicrosporidium saccamoebae]